ncbi:putative transcription regulator Homeodomain-LIKE family [Helianthus debilis subsp. tardiflorus]
MSLGDSDKVKPFGQRQQSTAAMLTSLQLAFARETWGWCRRLHENLIRSARVVLDAYSYPKDLEKILRQTGLARSQIADWFINDRLCTPLETNGWNGHRRVR